VVTLSSRKKMMSMAVLKEWRKIRVPVF
jgi:hypothetical protein